MGRWDIHPQHHISFVSQLVGRRFTLFQTHAHFVPEGCSQRQYFTVKIGIFTRCYFQYCRIGIFFPDYTTRPQLTESRP